MGVPVVRDHLPDRARLHVAAVDLAGLSRSAGVALPGLGLRRVIFHMAVQSLVLVGPRGGSALAGGPAVLDVLPPRRLAGRRGRGGLVACRIAFGLGFHCRGMLRMPVKPATKTLLGGKGTEEGIKLCECSFFRGGKLA